VKPLKRGINTLLAEVKGSVRGIDATEAVKLLGDPAWLIVDVRDARERARDGFIPHSFHCPRGMVEFWIDLDSPYFKQQFGTAQNLLFHCAADWRSMLTVHTVTQMGVEKAFHLAGGLKAWKDAGGPITCKT
jgi:rhodanese-related sulfurtransferase